MSISVPSKSNPHSQSEKPDFGDRYGVLSFSGDTAPSASETAVYRLLDFHILPVLTMMLLLAFLVRSLL
jgi:hypothetical protein